MPIVTGKTPEGLIKHAQKAFNEKWWYVWGTFGNKLTESLLETKAKQYPRYNNSRPGHKEGGEVRFLWSGAAHRRLMLSLLSGRRGQIESVHTRKTTMTKDKETQYERTGQIQQREVSGYDLLSRLEEYRKKRKKGT